MVSGAATPGTVGRAILCSEGGYATRVKFDTYDASKLTVVLHGPDPTEVGGRIDVVNTGDLPAVTIPYF